MSTKVKWAIVAFIQVMLFASNDVTAGGSLCAGRLCNGGQCVSRSTFCDGKCDCSDCDDENIQTCSLYDEPDRGGSSDDGRRLASGAIVGIVVAAICVLLLLIALLIVFIVCRIRREALKNLRDRRRRRGPLDAAAAAPGCALPVDIPIEALTRQPPPQYTPRAEAMTPSGSPQFNISVLPPPYYAPGASATAEFSCSYDEAPPKYRSSNDLSSKPAPDHHGIKKIQLVTSEAVDLRRTSVDSFVDEPSMSNILMTSSRSSGLGSTSCSNLHLNGFSPPPPGHGAGSSGGSTTSQAHLSSLTSRSQSLSNMYCGSVEIPGREIQKKRTGKERSVPPSTRSVPCLDAISIQGRAAPGKQSTEDEEESSTGKPKQGKYRKKTTDERGAHAVSSSADSRTPSTATEGGGGGGVRLRDPASCSASQALSSSSSSSSSAARGLSTRRRISRSLPQLTILQEEDQPWREMESCDV